MAPSRSILASGPSTICPLVPLASAPSAAPRARERLASDASFASHCRSGLGVRVGVGGRVGVRVGWG